MFDSSSMPTPMVLKNQPLSTNDTLVDAHAYSSIVCAL